MPFWILLFALWAGVADAQDRPFGDPNFYLAVEEARASGKVDQPLHVTLFTDSPERLASYGIDVQSRWDGFVTALGTADALLAALRDGVASRAEVGEMQELHNDAAAAMSGVMGLREGLLNGTRYTGRGVIACVLDSGLDFFHRDFRHADNPARSRVIRYWDMLISPLPSERSPNDFSYGVEWTRDQIEASIAGANTVRSQDTNGHGTHVAGTFGGNGTALGRHVGIAPEVEFVIVNVGSTGITNQRAIDGLAYCSNIATELGRPMVANMSFGGFSGGNDGSDAKSRAIASYATQAGRAMVSSAGNNGSLNVHRNGSVPGNGSITFDVVVPTFTPNAGRNNDQFILDFWFSGANNAQVTVTSPFGLTWTQNNASQSTYQSPDGAVYIYNFNDPDALHRRIYVRVYDDVDTQTPAVGRWTVSITNQSTQATPYHVWLTSGSTGNATTTLTGGTNSHTLGNTGRDAFIVGSYVTRWRWCSVASGCFLFSNAFDGTDDLSSFSSRGPSRDGRILPNITAPGQGMFSALSQFLNTSGQASRVLPGSLHRNIQGTSMSAPVVSGILALLLQQNPNLTYPELLNLVTASARTDVFTGQTPNSLWGAGKINAWGAMARLTQNTSREERVLVYDLPQPGGAVAVNAGQRIGVRFTHGISGNAVPVGAMIHIGNGSTLTAPLQVELLSYAGGQVGSRVGNPVFIPHTEIDGFAWQYVALRGTNATLAPGQDYVLTVQPTGTGDVLNLRHDASVATGRTVGGGDVLTTQNWNALIRTVVASEGVSTSAETDSPLQAGAFTVAPNPFRGMATVRFTPQTAERARLTVYDLLGRQVAELFSETTYPGQAYEVPFAPTGLPSGTYVARLEMDGKVFVRMLTFAP